MGSRGLITPVGAAKLPANLTARSWVLVDLDSGTVLAARDPHGRYQPASILKCLTALTVLPNLPAKRLVTVSGTAASTEGSAVGLLAGAKYTVDDLFRALLLVSGNDAAVALAEANGGVATTVREMNIEARALGAYDTYVETPSGLDGWQQLTSAYDMALILRSAVDNSRLVAYDKTMSATYPPKSSRYGQVGPYQFENQTMDFFQHVPGAIFAKTGFTDAAAHTFLAAAQRHGRRLGVVFLRNQRTPIDQWQQAAALFNWGYSLPASVTPIGVLAGPIGASDGDHREAGASQVPKPTTDESQPASRPPRPLQAAAGEFNRARSILGLSAAALAILGAVVAIRRLIRRPAPRRR